jgi:hypothetical protein
MFTWGILSQLHNHFDDVIAKPASARHPAHTRVIDYKQLAPFTVTQEFLHCAYI